MGKPRKTIDPKRGEVYLVNLDPTIGSEIKKTRPALILQNDVANHYSPVTIVAAITSLSDEKLYPTEVKVLPETGGLDQSSVVLLNQLRTIDKERLIKKLGTLEKDTMEKINSAILVSLGLVE